MLVRELLEWQEDIRFDRPACRRRVPLTRSATDEGFTNKNKTRRKRASHCSPHPIAVYLLILSMVVFNSGTLSLRGDPPPSNTRPKEKNYFCFSEKDFDIDASASTL